MIAYYDAYGKYLWTGTETIVVPNTGQPPPHPLEAIAYGKYVGVVDIATQYHDTALNVPTDMPAKPGTSWVFDYSTKAWVQNSLDAWSKARGKRDRLLKDTDWYVTKAVEQGNPMPAGVAAYRQALRDITEQLDPFDLVWPVLPV